MRAKFFFDQCITKGVFNFARIYRKKVICPFWVVNLLLVSTVYLLGLLCLPQHCITFSEEIPYLTVNHLSQLCKDS